MNNKKQVYLLSGLGADKRVFDFLDLKAYDTACIEWVKLRKDETLRHYARRIQQQIKHKKPILIGVSFGGVMAIEIGKLMETEKIILISSIETKDDIPVSNKWIGWFKINKLIPASFFTKVNDGLYWAFSVEKEEEKELLKSIIEDSDPDFLKWGIDQILNWKNEERLPNVVSIHGTDDRIFPDRKANYNIEGGGHLMLINRSSEISKIIAKIIDGN